MDIPVGFDHNDVEEGELGPIDDYDPAFEYPGEEEVSQNHPEPRTTSSSSPAASGTNKTTTLRLVVLHSTILSRAKRIAVLDGYSEISIGRDVTTSARIRLKEMAVSKFHASIYWDSSRREWAIVDMGSMHGTFVRFVRDPSSLTTGSEPKLGTRLSEPRKASMPRVLRHLDQVTIGGTTFLVHEHLNARPCPDCTIEGQVEIPLFSSAAPGNHTPSTESNSGKRKSTTVEGERNPKKAMAKLKSDLLSRHNSLSTPANSKVTYKDRSALRRELHPEARVPILPPLIRPEQQPDPLPILRAAPPSPPPTPPQPLPSSNIGHKLLLLQGWSPGTALGETPGIGLLEPLDLFSNASRAGLGSSVPPSRPPSQPPGDWKEEAKRRRWHDVEGR